MPFSTSGRWRLGLAVVAAKLVLLALLAWWWGSRGGPVAPAAPPGPARAAAAAGGASSPQAAGTLASAPATRPGPGAAAALAASAVAPPGVPASAAQAGGAALTEVTLEICEVGRVTVKLPPPGEAPAAEETFPHLFEHAQNAAWPQVLATLEGAADEVSRAAAAVLRVTRVADPGPREPPLDNAATGEALQRLALLAQQSRHTAVLQWAWALCTQRAPAPACQGLSPQAVLDSAPDDGRLWVNLASTLADPDEREQALRRAAEAPRYGPGPSLLPAVQAALPPGLPAHVRMMLLMQTLMADLQLLDSYFSFLVQHCRSHPEARPTCLALAETMSARGPDLLTMAVGRRIGQTLGWPEERVAGLQRAQQALQSAHILPDPTILFSCSSIQRTTAWLEDRAQNGERAALQRLAREKALSAPAAPGAASR
jgi:hypothetical protein